LRRLRRVLRRLPDDCATGRRVCGDRDRKVIARADANELTALIRRFEVERPSRTLVWIVTDSKTNRPYRRERCHLNARRNLQLHAAQCRGASSVPDLACIREQRPLQKLRRERTSQ